MLGLGRWLEKQDRMEQTTDGKQWDALVARELVAVMEMNEAGAAGVA